MDKELGYLGSLRSSSVCGRGVGQSDTDKHVLLNGYKLGYVCSIDIIMRSLLFYRTDFICLQGGIKMILSIINADRKKLKRAPLWLAFIFMPIIPALLGTLNYSANLEILENGWYSLWTQNTLFTCYFFLPIMLGIYCSYLISIERANHNWNKVLSMPVPVWQVFLSKLIISSFMLIISEVWIGVLFIVSGKLAGIDSALPSELLVWLGCGTLGGIVLVSAQLLVSLIIKNFAAPVGIALIGGLSGLAALAKGFGHIYPYSLMAFGMNSNAPQRLMEGGYLNFTLTCIIYIVIFTTIGSVYLSVKEQK